LSDRDRTFAGTVDVPVAPNWKPRDLPIVGVIQERDSRRNSRGWRSGAFIQTRERFMKNVMCGGFVAVVLTMSTAAGAQAHKMDDKMNKMKVSYTGCIERSPDGGFTLGHAMASSATTKKSMAMDSMAKESMAKDAMAKDSMAHDSMTKDATASTLALAGTSVDLAKHVGHKVTVNGVAGGMMDGLATLNVKSIKIIGASCS
jgi:pentapeptide MXKDX repeat protein